jgi:hypothetical protein
MVPITPDTPGFCTRGAETPPIGSDRDHSTSGRAQILMPNFSRRFRSALELEAWRVSSSA